MDVWLWCTLLGRPCTACGIRVLPLEKVWPRILFTVLLLIGSYGCFCKYQQKSKTVEACKQWTKSRMFYHSGAYRQAVESYAEIQKEMKGNARLSLIHI